LIPVGFGEGDGDGNKFFLWGWVWDSETRPCPALLPSLGVGCGTKGEFVMIVRTSVRITCATKHIKEVIVRFFMKNERMRNIMRNN